MTDRIIKEYLSKEGIKFIQQSCKQEEHTPEEIEKIKEEYRKFFNSFTAQDMFDILPRL